MNKLKKLIIFILIVLISTIFIIIDFKNKNEDLVNSNEQGTIIIYSDTEETVTDPYEVFIDLAITIAKNEPTYPEVNGETTFAALFGNPTYDWCTEFIMYCLQQAETQLNTTYINDIYPWYDSAYSCGLFYIQNDRYFLSGTYTPVKGDLIFFDYEGNGYPNHTGLVIGTKYEYGIEFVITIEGNIPGDEIPQIRIIQLPIDDPDILAYGSSFSISDYAKYSY